MPWQPRCFWTWQLYILSHFWGWLLSDRLPLRGMPVDCCHKNKCSWTSLPTLLKYCLGISSGVKFCSLFSRLTQFSLKLGCVSMVLASLLQSLLLSLVPQMPRGSIVLTISLKLILWILFPCCWFPWVSVNESDKLSLFVCVPIEAQGFDHWFSSRAWRSTVGELLVHWLKFIPTIWKKFLDYVKYCKASGIVSVPVRTLSKLNWTVVLFDEVMLYCGILWVWRRNQWTTKLFADLSTSLSQWNLVASLSCVLSSICRNTFSISAGKTILCDLKVNNIFCSLCMRLCPLWRQSLTIKHKAQQHHSIQCVFCPAC